MAAKERMKKHQSSLIRISISVPLQLAGAYQNMTPKSFLKFSPQLLLKAPKISQAATKRRRKRSLALKFLAITALFITLALAANFAKASLLLIGASLPD